MLILVIFSFIAGVVTVLSPCILPILPIILSSGIAANKKSRSRPIGVVIGFVGSFTFFTLFLSSLVRISGIPAENLRFFSIAIILFFGVSLLIPRFQAQLEKLFARLSRFTPKTQNKHGFWGGVVIGFSVGLLWTPCVGPILASVISLALTGKVTFETFLITFTYALGTAIPMFAIIVAGQKAVSRLPWLTSKLAIIQKVFGLLMITTAIAIYFNIDRQFQNYILNRFPNYGLGLTKIEDNDTVVNELNNINNNQIDKNRIGKPMDSLPKGKIAPEIIPGGKWFNSQPLSLSNLRGKVVILDFWTYTCINCQRTIPYLNSWWEKYKDQGLVIIGIHSPEFEFEKADKNVAQAIKDFGITYPVVQDNDFATWRAYNNRYWPAKYFIDKDGFVRYSHFGEGAYDESERVIQQLLSEVTGYKITQDVNNDSYQTFSKTPETYLGYLRIANFASPEKIQPDKLVNYSFPASLASNKFAFDGNWLITPEFASPQKGARLQISFEAKEVYLVARPKETSAKVTVYVDGQIQYAGQDSEGGVWQITSDRLYKLVNLPSAGRHVLTLVFEDGMAEVFAFTFG